MHFPIVRDRTTSGDQGRNTFGQCHVTEGRHRRVGGDVADRHRSRIRFIGRPERVPFDRVPVVL
jgi:hypothetical protein